MAPLDKARPLLSFYVLQFSTTWLYYRANVRFFIPECHAKAGGWLARDLTPSPNPRIGK